jgi:16S rRNA processing protein RimM
MDRILIGQVVNVVGLKGELKIYHYSDNKERFEELTKVLLENIPYEIKSVRYVKETVVLKLHGIDDRSQAEKYKGKNVYIDREDLRTLPEDTYYIFELIGLRVVEENGNFLGTVSNVIQNRAHDLFEVECVNRSKFLIPSVEEFILNLDMENRTMTVRLIEGLLDE